MNKLSHFVGHNWEEYTSAPIFERQEGSKRLIAALPSGAFEMVKALASSFTPPYQLLYVLHTPRGEAAPGRYQSPPLSAEELDAFFARYSEFLSSDARFDIWFRSAQDEATLVWDRHNLLYCYGPLHRFSALLKDLGFVAGSPIIPSPHAHNYHSEFDPQAKDLIGSLDWNHTPLHPQDEQVSAA
ncbi:MAG: hypothetical protein A3E01_08660 [Gammaproteobacteria bacterium RIFCSPHIGHO2_12_FULL_63_22]|nr:MAG: hypothetical protein A3E01_08660 [Gammaproteobacteria bacterium RIFCSPHIGHO2_12_FULL_63_22]